VGGEKSCAACTCTCLQYGVVGRMHTYATALYRLTRSMCTGPDEA
jgi:hypothetical protein